MSGNLLHVATNIIYFSSIHWHRMKEQKVVRFSFCTFWSALNFILKENYYVWKKSKTILLILKKSLKKWKNEKEFIKKFNDLKKKRIHIKELYMGSNPPPPFKFVIDPLRRKEYSKKEMKGNEKIIISRAMYLNQGNVFSSSKKRLSSSTKCKLLPRTLNVTASYSSLYGWRLNAFRNQAEN